MPKIVCRECVDWTPLGCPRRGSRVGQSRLQCAGLSVGERPAANCRCSESIGRSQRLSRWIWAFDIRSQRRTTNDIQGRRSSNLGQTPLEPPCQLECLQKYGHRSIASPSDETRVLLRLPLARWPTQRANPSGVARNFSSLRSQHTSRAARSLSTYVTNSMSHLRYRSLVLSLDGRAGNSK